MVGVLEGVLIKGSREALAALRHKNPVGKGILKLLS
jgi:hypothetical protein